MRALRCAAQSRARRVGASCGAERGARGVRRVSLGALRRTGTRLRFRCRRSRSSATWRSASFGSTAARSHTASRGATWSCPRYRAPFPVARGAAGAAARNLPNRAFEYISPSLPPTFADPGTVGAAGGPSGHVPPGRRRGGRGEGAHVRAVAHVLPRHALHRLQARQDRRRVHQVHSVLRGRLRGRFPNNPPRKRGVGACAAGRA